jgi:sulfatase maturation enzyme AslB (radical SAM superfamily)
MDKFKLYKDAIEFVVSFDGLYHDENRVYINGEGSMKYTIKGLKLLNLYGYNYYATCCLMPNRMKDLKENISYIREVIGDRQINLSFIRGAIEAVKERVLYPGILQQQYTNEGVNEFTKDIVALINEGYNIYIMNF